MFEWKQIFLMTPADRKQPQRSWRCTVTTTSCTAAGSDWGRSHLHTWKHHNWFLQSFQHCSARTAEGPLIYTFSSFWTQFSQATVSRVSERNTSCFASTPVGGVKSHILSEVSEQHRPLLRMLRPAANGPVEVRLGEESKDSKDINTHKL